MSAVWQCTKQTLGLNAADMQSHYPDTMQTNHYTNLLQVNLMHQRQTL